MIVNASAPGRICLFGEHQDYFGLPVAAAAIDLRGHIHSASRSDRTVELHLEDMDEVHIWNLDALPEPGPRAYWLAALHIARKEGWLPENGWRAEVTSAIPQQAGASSSSALTAAWCALIATRAGKSFDQEWVAHATWRVEVAFFDEPGGMMDQVMCAMGGVRTVDFHPAFATQPVPCPTGEWLLIDSEQPKDTLGILSRAKHQRLELLEEWGASLHACVQGGSPFLEEWGASLHAGVQGGSPFLEELEPLVLGSGKNAQRVFGLFGVDQQPLACRTRNRLRRERRMKIDRSHPAHGTHYLVHHAPRFIKKRHFHAPCRMGHPFLIKRLPSPRGDQCTPRCRERTRTARTGLLRNSARHFCPPSVFRQPTLFSGDVKCRQPIRTGAGFRQCIQVPYVDFVHIF